MTEPMGGTSQFFVSNTNAEGGGDYFPNANGINLPATPSVLDLNRIMSQTNNPQPETASPKSAPIFGTHIKEALTIVKDWVHSGKK